MSLYLFIGGKGGDATSEYDNGPVGYGGFNGGSEGSTGINSYPTAGSGGATDVRLDINKLDSRIMVAGGGGSSGFWTKAGSGGDGGGTIVATGTPEEVAKNKSSYTGQFLSRML